MGYTHKNLLFLATTTLLLSSLLILPSDSATQCNQDDSKALLAIKSSVKPSSAATSWGQSNNCCDRTWYSVECNPSGRVTSFSIAKDTVAGRIPPEVGDLPYLTSLAIYKLTNLSGSIPHSITKLKDLTLLRLQRDSLTGTFPAFLSQLSKLTYLNLAENQFTGSIPASLGSLPLSTLRIDRNRLSGPIPDSLGRIPAEFLYLYRNSLSGPIPRSFADARFEYLDLSRNKLTGDASFLFAAASPIRQLDLATNALRFDLTGVKLPKNLTYLDVSNNRIYGAIPGEFVTRDWTFNVSRNMLCGEIPAGGRNLDPTAFLHNKCLCGPPLPACK